MYLTCVGAMLEVVHCDCVRYDFLEVHHAALPIPRLREVILTKPSRGLWFTRPVYSAENLAGQSHGAVSHCGEVKEVTLSLLLA